MEQAMSARNIPDAERQKIPRTIAKAVKQKRIRRIQAGGLPGGLKFAPN
ncbi:MAG: hypothetical protein HDT27_08940 [Subdoligranulum sp.]|nr:hypothetical protein [Subdoligranulum sp.]MBD5101165.1 hypothetical protein [Subdoligranulum sp.]MBD5102797.1 hypothetical protein [Subdoligranulum sp.]